MLSLVELKKLKSHLLYQYHNLPKPLSYYKDLKRINKEIEDAEKIATVREQRAVVSR